MESERDTAVLGEASTSRHRYGQSVSCINYEATTDENILGSDGIASGASYLITADAAVLKQLRSFHRHLNGELTGVKGGEGRLFGSEGSRLQVLLHSR